jgi:hypothetical protein
VHKLPTSIHNAELNGTLANTKPNLIGCRIGRNANIRLQNLCNAGALRRFSAECDFIDKRCRTL